MEEEEREPTAEELRNIAIDNIQVAIEDFLQLIGSEGLLTDWVVLAVAQESDPSGYYPASTILVPREGYLPDYRVKGLLHEGLDMLREKNFSAQQNEPYTEGEDDD